jgi:hypothetical protein
VQNAPSCDESINDTQLACGQLFFLVERVLAGAVARSEFKLAPKLLILISLWCFSRQDGD